MINIIKNTQCCGCTSCANACPKKAIRMQADHEGFLYPIFDTKLCVDCGICDKVCPVKKRPERSRWEVKSYVLRSKKLDILMHSTSGGFITPLAMYVLEHNGVMCAASYDKEFKVKHTIIEKMGGGGTTLHSSEAPNMCRVI